MSRLLRNSIYGVFGLLWLSGALWTLLHFRFATPTEFGVSRHPWEPSLLLLHGIAAIVSSYLFGWIAARHIADGWRQRKRRWSGALLSSVLVSLGLTGFALFFVSDDSWQQRITSLHEVVGIAVALSFLQHWFFGRRVPAS